MKDKVRVGIVGSQFEAEIHALSFAKIPHLAEVVAAASPQREHVEAFVQRFRIPRAYTDYRRMLEDRDIDLITICAPNDLHAQITIDAAQSGKHVVCEKPLCLNLEEAEAMIQACQRNHVFLFYAEELCFAPKYVRAKELAEEGAFGKVYLVKQSEKHFGPHSAWFWDVERSGGGVLMDMGCHGIEFARWFLNKKRIKSVYAHLGTYVHGGKTKGEDESLTILEFEDNAYAVIEDSWAKRGGMDDRAEIYGEGGVTYAILHMGISLITYSEYGYGYAVEKAPTTKGWTFTVYEELWNYGFPQEMEHFAKCVMGLEKPIETGEDGKTVLEVIMAAYQSAREGRKIILPFTPQGVKKPIDLWLGEAP